MLKKYLLFLVAGLVGGYAIGYMSKSQPMPVLVMEPEPPIHEVEIETPEAAPTPSGRPTEQELLLMAIDEFGLLSEELDDARSYIHKLERNNKRYNRLVDYWKENGFGSSYRMNFGHGRNKKPSDELIKFFGWDKEQVDRMSEAGKSTGGQIKNWESDHSVCIEDSEDRLVYEIEPIPQGVRDDYLEAMATIIDPDDMELISSKLAKQFETKQVKRTVTLTIDEAPSHMQHISQYSSGKEYMIITERSAEEKGLGASTSYMSYKPGKTIPHSWNHVFNMEGDGGFTASGDWEAKKR